MPNVFAKASAALPLCCALVATSTSSLQAQASACAPGTSRIATETIAMLRRLVARTDSAAASIRADYHIQAGVTSAEFVAVSDPDLCARAASLYFQARDGSSAGTRDVLLLRLRDVFYILDQDPYAAPGHPIGQYYAVIADSSLTAARLHIRSR